jgi:ribonucleoside-triphosphate reductase
MKRTRCEIYSRVVGFLSPVSQWNRGKKEEFRDRVTFKGEEVENRNA